AQTGGHRDTQDTVGDATVEISVLADEHVVGVQRVEIPGHAGERHDVGFGNGAPSGDDPVSDANVLEINGTHVNLLRPRSRRRLPQGYRQLVCRLDKGRLHGHIDVHRLRVDVDD